MLWASDPAPARAAGRVVRVLPDEPAIDKTFDYLVPESLGDQVRVGTRVRVALGGRRVGGWIVAVDVVSPPGVTPRPLAKISGYGPPAELIDLARWAAWRWAGRTASFLRTANPDRIVTALPTPTRRPPTPPTPPIPTTPLAPLITAAFTPPPTIPPPAAAGPPSSGRSAGPPTAGAGPAGPPPVRAVPGARAGSPLSGGSASPPVAGPTSAGPPAAGAAPGAPAGPPASGGSASPPVAVPRSGGPAGSPPAGAVPGASGGSPTTSGAGSGSLTCGGSGGARTFGAVASSGTSGGPTGASAAPAGDEAGDEASPRPGSVGAARGEGVRSVVRLAPAVDPYPVVRAAVGLGNALVICPTVALARSVGMRLRRDGVAVAFHPRDWAVGAAGATVVGTRAAAWAPVADLAAVVVLDEHDESHAQEQAPTWHARDVVAERARHAGVPCVLVSPCPSLEALAWGRLLAPSRHDERDGWPIVDVVDRRQDDPRTGLISPRLVDLLRSDRRVVCVLNRTGRAKLLACAACGELARCEACDAALAQVSDEATLACPRCGKTRPVVCAACGGTRLKLLRQGVSRVREELEALVGSPVDEVSSLKDGDRRPGSRVVVGTEAVLHQIDRADVVAFLDLDQELLAPRYRAVEQALSLLARAARLVGGKAGAKAGGGRLLLQTRVPRHEVVQAVLHGDPARVAEAEAERRALLRFPPAAALAEVSGPAAPAYIASLRTEPEPPAGPAASPPDLWSSAIGGPEPPAGAGDSHAGPREIEILGPADGRWLVRAPDHPTLCDALAGVPRPPGRLRLAVDPLRV